MKCAACGNKVEPYRLPSHVCEKCFEKMLLESIRTEKKPLA